MLLEIESDGEITDCTEDTDEAEMSDSWSDDGLDLKKSPSKKRMGKSGVSKISELASRIQASKLVPVGGNKEETNDGSDESDDEDFVPEKQKKPSSQEQEVKKWPPSNSKMRLCTSTGKIKEVKNCSVEHRGSVFKSIKSIEAVLESPKFVINDATVVVCQAKDTRVFYRTAAVFDKNEWTFVVLSAIQEVHIIKNTLNSVEKPQEWQEWKIRAAKFENKDETHSTKNAWSQSKC